jgi:hypothetical protein
VKEKRDTDVRMVLGITTTMTLIRILSADSNHHKDRQQPYNALQDLLEQHCLLGIIGRELTQAFGENNKGLALLFRGEC